jgi:hypothetical protein
MIDSAVVVEIGFDPLRSNEGHEATAPGIEIKCPPPVTKAG